MSTVNEAADTQTPKSERHEVIQRPQAVSREDDKGAHLDVALPGVRKEDIRLSVHGQNLHIEAAREDGVPADWRPLAEVGPRVRYRLTARLTHQLDGNAVAADFQDGILSVTIPVREEAKPREVAIH